MKKIKTIRRNSWNWFDSLNTTVMLLFCVSIIFPFWDMIVRSLSDPYGAGSLELMLLPKNFTLSAYQYVLRDNKIVQAFGVTILRTVTGVAISLMMTLLAAYPLSKKDLPFRKYITLFFLVPMFFTGGIIPSYIINRELGFVDSFWVYVLPTAVNIYNVILARNYFMSIDKGLEESAFIDGAGYATILFRIIVPIAKPIIATLALWVAVSQWNAWMDCMIYIRDEALTVVQMILRRMIDLTQMQNEQMQMFMLSEEGGNVTSASVRMATTVITVVPIMLVYPFLQRYFVKGIMVGSLKG